MKALYTLLFSVTLFTLHAQSITDPSLPAEGKVMNFDQIDDTIAVSCCSPWDFSTINPTASYTMSVFPIDSSFNGFAYPAASHVLVSATGEFFMGYDQNGITNHGRISSGFTGFTTNYTTPLTLIPFPFDANTVHVDSITSTATVGVVPISAGFTDKADVTGLAAGEVTMPNGHTYQNAVVARAKRTQIAGPSPTGSFLRLEENSTVFWLQGYPLPVIEVLHVFQDDSLIFQRSLFLREDSVIQPPVGIASIENMSIELFPNPVGNTLKIYTEHAASLSLYNTKGELIISRDVAAGSTSIEVSNLTNGIYIYHIVDDKGNVSMNQLVKE